MFISRGFADFDSFKIFFVSFFLFFSLLPQMSLGGFEITPPVTFRLQSGSGPVHISGQHFVRKLSVCLGSNQAKNIVGNACISSGVPLRIIFLSSSSYLNYMLLFFVGVKNSEDEEEENNTSPVKRPSALMSGKRPPLVVTSRSCSVILLQ